MNSLGLLTIVARGFLCTRWTKISISLPFRFNGGCWLSHNVTEDFDRNQSSVPSIKFSFFSYFHFFFFLFSAHCVQLYYCPPMYTLFVRKPSILKVSFNGWPLANFVPFFDLFCGILSDYIFLKLYSLITMKILKKKKEKNLYVIWQKIFCIIMYFFYSNLKTFCTCNLKRDFWL